jgi:hypothetical protein
LFIVVVPPLSLIAFWLAFRFEARCRKLRGGAPPSRWVVVLRGALQGLLTIVTGVCSPFLMGIFWGAVVRDSAEASKHLPSELVAYLCMVAVFWMSIAAVRIVIEQTYRLASSRKPVAASAIAMLSLPEVMLCICAYGIAMVWDAGSTRADGVNP